jgi:hypothetical protein
MDIFKRDIKKYPGGVLIADIINNEQVVLLGKTNFVKTYEVYETFGGGTEEDDLTSLHTAIREFVEEFFNYKVSTNLINEIAYKLRTHNKIIKQHNFSGVAYLLNFSGLNLIFQLLLVEILDLEMYNKNNNFDLQTYINDRIINSKPSGGLNEIGKIRIFKLTDIKKGKVNIRKLTKQIINKMLLHN